MAKDQNGTVKLAKILVPIIVAIVLIPLGISKWTVSKTMQDIDKMIEKTVELDKAVSKEIVSNKLEHDAFEKADITILREQRMLGRKIEKKQNAMDSKIDKINDTLTKNSIIAAKIAAKLDVDTP